jgi:Cyclin, C-terminal domain/Cyclin, N-terminal domain
MSTPSGQDILVDRNLYQLAAMTALYTSVKIHEQEAMDPKLVSSLSRGVHSPQAVEAMEARLLNAIQWRVNPPTALSFVRMMMNLVPEQMLGASEREATIEVTRFQIEMSVNEYAFCCCPASSIALAAILNSIESVSEDGMLHAGFESTLGSAIGIDARGLRHLRIALYELMNGSGDMVMFPQNPASATKMMENSSCGELMSAHSCHASPRSVNA